MSSLLQQTRVPLGAWILVIVVGSLLLLGTIAFIIRLLIVRRRKADFVDTFGDENLPQRKITVRRGRIVEQSKYLSLTGSQFGMNAFNLEDGDRSGARSKSPFEWWASVKDRSQTRDSRRNSQMTEVTNDPLYSQPTSPQQARIYQRRDLTYSSTSLASSGKGSDLSVSVHEDPMSLGPVRNFSRSFSRGGNRRPSALSRIEESSPHTSIISARQSQSPAFPHNLHRDTKSSLSTLSPLPSRPTSRGHSQQYLQFPKGRIESTSYEVLPSPRSDMAVVGYHGSRSSYGNPHHRLSQISSHCSLREASVRISVASSAHVTALPPAPPTPTKETSQHWQCRTDDNEVRRSSSLKQGKVLRKKSLKRAEMVQRIDS